MQVLKEGFNSKRAVALFVAALSMPAAQAVEIKADVSGSVGSGATPLLFSDVDGPAGSGSVDVLNSQVDGPDDVFYHTYGSDTGNFGSRVSGNGVYDLSGTFSYKDTITNSTGMAQSYDFDFTIIPGELSLSGTPASPGDFLMAEYTVDILVDGISIWGSSAKVEKDDSSSSANFTFGGTSLGGTQTDLAAYSSYFWDSYSDTIGLGMLNAGESLEFEYLLTAHAAGNIENCTGDFEGGFDGVRRNNGADGIDFGMGELAGTCGSIARSGDPFDFGGSDPNFAQISSSPVETVPEPAPLALLGIGMAAIAAGRRRKGSKC